MIHESSNILCTFLFSVNFDRYFTVISEISLEKSGPKKKKIIGVILRLNKLPQPEVVVVVGVGDTLVVTAAVDDDVEFVTTFMVVPLGVDDGCIVSLMHALPV